MHKNLVWAVAGATVILAVTGCAPTKVMQTRNITPAVDDPPLAAPAPAVMPPASAQAQVIPAAPQAAPQRAVQNAPAVQDYPLMTGVTASGGVSSAASASGTAAGGKQQIHIVRRGDSPDRIARRYRVRLSDLMKANNLTNESAKRLRIGQKLIVPARRSAAAGRAANRPVPGTMSGGKYTVRQGDSPERIARKFKVRLSALMQANNLTEASARRLRVGQQLIIPGTKPRTETAAAAAPAARTATAVASRPAAGSSSAAAAERPQTPAAGTPALSGTTAGSSGKWDGSVDVVCIEAPISLSDYAAQHGIPLDMLKATNPGVGATLNKYDWLYVPKL